MLQNGAAASTAGGGAQRLTGLGHPCAPSHGGLVYRSASTDTPAIAVAEKPVISDVRLCTLCGHETLQPLRKLPGTGWVSLLLLVPFVLPGVVYEVWRWSMRRQVCPRCGSTALIPGDAPLARTWRAAGWIAGSPAAIPSEDRFERIEQAIDAMSVEIERMRVQPQLRAGEAGERDLRLRGPTTPH